MQFKDYYQTLGVEPGSGEAEIKTAYRRLARKFHPDKNKEKDAEERFKAVSEAYEVLRDKEKRADYDQLRARGYRPGEEFRPPPDFSGAGRGGQARDFNFEFGDGGGGAGFSDFFESMFGGRGGRAQAAPSGDSRVKLNISLEIAYSGGSQRINLDGKMLDVKIPVGIRPGQVIRLSGQGRGKGAQRGDLLLEIDYQPHAQFEVDGRNILHTLAINPWEAALGCTLPVATLGGSVELRIPADSDAGRRLRLRGRGLPGKPEAGDQIVEIEIRAPRAETEAQKALYQQMAEAFDSDRTGR